MLESRQSKAVIAIVDGTLGADCLYLFFGAQALAGPL